MTARTAHVVAASNRAATGVYEDRTGPIIVAWLRERGYEVSDPEVVADGDPVGRALRSAVAAGTHVVITTGGTGISPTDRTPDVTAEVLDYRVPGLADAVRSAGLPEVPAAVLSRGVAGVSGRTLIVNLPGSRGGVRDGLGVLDGVLDHAVDQVHGGDHVTARESSEPTAAAEVLRADVTEELVEVDALARAVQHRSAGAVVTFGGVVRDHDGGRGVREMEYVGHPSAGEVIATVADDVASRFEGVRAIAASHRVGLLDIGDVALGCAVAAEHRRAAFEACSELVDEVKRRLPVWKRQVFDDATEEWVNCP
ncbi:molybdenum cofactor synthesis domain-containing protein [Saccharopolyspora lacisalsi]|uniref:Molybdenum cofactor synthesis domain-containing protein n=1 Tax=Halosaccharopolyspora lacisalsi TaxID=1000566 RepID=A0A839DYZ3_9PSEU|nr:molybdenum cofactor biosynthesis protein MoaE [Halosaccharopolyspora lacisalsi]MBA8826714.1 molybdenum cofactor synthesis domain-containing protein [Halosaccharopolyspora lacisalsi]